MKLSKHALVRNTWSIFMLAFFTVFWAYSASWGFGWNLFTIICIVIFGVYEVWLCVEAIRTIRALRTLPDLPATESDRRIRKHFLIIFGIEIILIMMSSIILSTNIVGNSNYIIPVIAIIVGVHFLPLSSVFHTRMLFFAGIIMIVVAGAAIILIIDGKWIHQSIGVCALTAAICVAVMSASLLHRVKAGLKDTKN